MTSIGSVPGCRARIYPSVVRRLTCALAICFLFSGTALFAEDGAAGWLRYAPLSPAAAAKYRSLPAVLVLLDKSAPAQSAEEEAEHGMHAMLGRILREDSSLPQEDAFVLGIPAEIQRVFPGWTPAQTLAPGGYAIGRFRSHEHSYWLIAGEDGPGILYATFALLADIAEQKPIEDTTSSPAAPIRWVNQWDNLDGSIERGYAGRSIFFDNGSVRQDLGRAGEYARLLSSVGINGCTINNVNADVKMLTPEMIHQVARIADAFRPWGVRLSMSVDISSPKAIGGLDSFDPLDPKVIKWWRERADDVYAAIPDFGGFVVKADSEGRAGPSQYGRSPADAANTIAGALKPHGGVLLYRAFVYNHHLDWNDLKADRARAAYDIFHPLDGRFGDNVIVQIKNGPIDFQVREPASPLFAGLRQTNEAIELQITQEYTGQQRQLVYLVPMWKTTLDFDMRVDGEHTPVSQIVEGRTFHRPLGGFAGVANVGLDANWLKNPLAMANLYGFGRLAWDPDTSSEQIAEDWTRLTFGSDPLVVKTISEGMLLPSWRIYEDYTGPLGLGTLSDILHSHYGPGVETAEHNGWGQWIRADHQGVGMDRTVRTGTGYIGQYPPEVAAMYESLATCPDDLLLFMHHVAYTHQLHSGETVIQYLYDSHYRGAEGAAGLLAQWQKLRGLVDEERYDEVLAIQQYQAGYAIVWRDAISSWFEKMSGIPDAKGRVGRYPNRIEAESMRLEGYAPVDVTPWETASGGKAVVCQGAASCSASVKLDRPSGWYSIAVQYFDLRHGESTYQVFLNRQLIAQWRADAALPGEQPNGDTSTRQTIHRVPLRPGDDLRIVGRPDDGEPAPLDYLEIDPDR